MLNRANKAQLDFDILLCSHNPQFKSGKKQLKKTNVDEKKNNL